MTRKRFADRDAQRPDVRGRRDRTVARFRRIVDGDPSHLGHFAERPNPVTRQLQLFADHENVRRLHAPERQPPVVQKRERAQHRHQHLARLVFRERTPLQQLCEILVGVFHHRVQVAEPHVAATDAKNLNQVRVRDIGAFIPARQLRLRTRATEGKQLQRRFGRRELRRLGEEHAAVIRAAEKAA
jgi:hypothetical protein